MIYEIGERSCIFFPVIILARCLMFIIPLWCSGFPNRKRSLLRTTAEAMVCNVDTLDKLYCISKHSAVQ